MLMNIGYEDVKLIRWNQLMPQNKTTPVQRFFKAIHFISKAIALENVMEQSGWCVLTDESIQLDDSQITEEALYS